MKFDLFSYFFFLFLIHILKHSVFIVTKELAFMGYESNLREQSFVLMDPRTDNICLHDTLCYVCTSRLPEFL